MCVVIEEINSLNTGSDSNDDACSGLSKRRPEVVSMRTRGDSRIVS